MSRGLTNVAARNQRGRGDTLAADDTVKPDLRQRAERHPSRRQLVIIDQRPVYIFVAVKQLVGLDGLLTVQDRLSSKKNVAHHAQRKRGSPRASRLLGPWTSERKRAESNGLHLSPSASSGS